MIFEESWCKGGGESAVLEYFGGERVASRGDSFNDVEGEEIRYGEVGEKRGDNGGWCKNGGEVGNGDTAADEGNTNEACGNSGENAANFSIPPEGGPFSSERFDLRLLLDGDRGDFFFGWLWDFNSFDADADIFSLNSAWKWKDQRWKNTKTKSLDVSLRFLFLWKKKEKKKIQGQCWGNQEEKLSLFGRET